MYFYAYSVVPFPGSVGMRLNILLYELVTCMCLEPFTRFHLEYIITGTILSLVPRPLQLYTGLVSLGRGYMQELPSLMS